MIARLYMAKTII